jgi:CheY-like chemotaxis protein
LVVDPWPDAANSLALLLKLWGYDVQVAYDGLTALHSACADPPDVVVAEVALPNVDGYQLARRLRLEPGGANALFVALTGFGQASYREQASQAGFDYFLVKGSNPNQLRNVLGQARRIGHVHPSLTPSCCHN